MKLTVTKGQMEYEAKHLLKKLQTREPALYREWKSEKKFMPHPMFDVVKGEVEDWEII